MNKLFIVLAFFFTQMHSMRQLSQPETDNKKENVLKEKYNIKKENCYLAVSKKKLRTHQLNRPSKNPHDDSPFIACLLTGYKNLLWTQPRNLENIDVAVKELAKEKKLQQILIHIPEKKEPSTIYARMIKGDKNTVILYLPDSEKKALLLAKYELSNLGGHYLSGLLLDYKPEDIDFFYKRLGFMNETYSYNKSLFQLAYSDWPEAKKEEFANFEKKWNAGGESIVVGKHLYLYPLFTLRNSKKIKRVAEKWLQDNSAFTVEQLRRQISEIAQKLGGSIQIKNFE